MEQNFAISSYPDVGKVIKQLDELIEKPIYTIRPEVLKDYEENYFEKNVLNPKR